MSATDTLQRPSTQAIVRAFGHPGPAKPFTEAETALLDTAQRRDISVRHTVRGHDEAHTLATWSWGRQGPRVLLVHGWESRASHWHAWVHPLLRAGFQVTAIDNLAHGQSTGDTANVRLWGQGLLAVAQAFGRIHAVIGHSAGSAASLYAFAHGLQVDASVHIAGPASLKRVATGFALAHGLPREEIAAFRAALELQLGFPMAEMDLPALQGGLRHPALILHDPQDKEVPFTESLALHEAWSLSQLLSVDGVGHRRILRVPEVIALVIGSLSTPAALAA